MNVRKNLPRRDEISGTKKRSPLLRREILKAAENQIRENNPPETKKTLERLQKKGYTRGDALVLIGGVLVTEIYEMLTKEEVFNEKRYTRALRALE